MFLGRDETRTTRERLSEKERTNDINFIGQAKYPKKEEMQFFFLTVLAIKKGSVPLYSKRLRNPKKHF